MPVLDVQRRGQQIGRIRLGVQVQTASGKMRPDKLSTFRFTTASRISADAIAELYGGEVRDWVRGQFEVITSKSEIGVTVPPRDQVVSQWYEMWNKGGCIRRCDSQHEQISDGPCLCPHAEDPDDEEEVARCALERANLAKANPPKACKLVTRISVMIPDLPGLGVFRLDSGSYYAASEIGDAALLMQAARDKGVLLPAVLRIEQRQRVAGGKTTNYPVPVLEVLATFRQIATGALEAGGIAAQLPPPPGEQPKAITAGPAAAPAPAADAGPEIEPMDWQVAQRIYERSLAASTRAAIEAIATEPEAQRLADEHVCTDSQADVWEPLHDALQAIWREKAREAS
jgi:Recombination directionality factor-like